jgi:chromosome segregation ATPase
METPDGEEGSVDDTLDAHELDRSHRAGIATNREDRRRSLDALHAVESSAANAAPGREDEWVAYVRSALGALQDALSTQALHSAGSDSPLTDIEMEEPRLRNRVIQLRRRYEDLQQRIAELHSQLDASGPDGIDIADVRRRLERLAGELRYQRAREADLVYEAYTLDLGAGD